MMVQGNREVYPLLVHTALRQRGAALSQIASTVNAVLIFTSFFGLLGVGIFLNAAESLLGLAAAEEAAG